jgi:hypothetical protein
MTTARDALNSGDPRQQAAALQAVKAGNAGSKIKVTFTGLADVAAQDITTAAAKAAAVIAGISLADGENLPPIGEVVTLRTTVGAMASHGPHIVTDAGGTALAPGAAIGVALLADDGATLTFQAGVTAFIIEYYPAPEGGMDQKLAVAAP